MKFSNFTVCPGGGAFDSLFCPEGRVFVDNDCHMGRVFAPFKSCPGEMVLDEIDTCITIYMGSAWLKIWSKRQIFQKIFLI